MGTTHSLLFSSSYSSDYVRLSFGLGNVCRVNKMPILQAVHDNTTVKGVFEFTIYCFEMSVAVVVGLFVCCHIVQNHLELFVCECRGRKEQRQLL